MNYQLFFDSTMPIFIDIMVWVAVSYLIFEAINLFTKDRFYQAIERSKKTQVLWAALLGLIPGCGGALLLVPLYNKRKVSFGALTAAFIATFGDAAFVILSNDPIIFLHLTWMGTVAAIATGYFIQITPIERKIQTWIDKKNPPKTNKVYEGYKSIKGVFSGPENKRYLSNNSWYVRTDRLVLPVMTIAVTLFIFPATIIGFFEAVPPQAEYYRMMGEWASYGITLFLIFYYLVRFFVKRYYVHSTNVTGITEHTDWATKTTVKSNSIIEGDEEEGVLSMFHTIFSQLVQITFWVWVGFYSFEIMNYYWAEGLYQFFSSASGWTAILIATLVGMIPGCGPQIALATFYFSVPGGAFVGAALLANTINQDGDAAFPLMVTEKKTSIAMRFMNTLPAILFATIYWGIAQSGVPMPF